MYAMARRLKGWERGYWIHPRWTESDGPILRYEAEIVSNGIGSIK